MHQSARDEWHLIDGLWQAVEEERRERLLARMLPGLREHLPSLDPAVVRVARLELPFYRRLDAGGRARTLDLFEVAIPADVDDLGLLRWAFVLWDGADEWHLIDWRSGVLHAANEAWGVDFGSTPEERSERAGLYLRVFCSLISGSQTEPGIETPFVLVDPALSNLGNDLVVPLGSVPLRDVSDPFGETPPDVATFATPELGAPKTTPSPALVVLYGREAFAAEFGIALRDVTEGIPRAIAVDMTDDAPIADPDQPGPSFRMFSVKRWKDGKLCFLVRDAAPRAWKAGMAVAEFPEFLEDEAVRCAQRGTFDRVGTSRFEEVVALLALHRRYAEWAPALIAPSIELEVGDLDLRACGPEQATPLECRLRVRVRGDLIFENVHFRRAMHLENWEVEGTIRGRAARFDSTLTLRNVVVRNAIQQGGQASPTAGVKGEFQTSVDPAVATGAEVAVDLCGMRVEGSAVLAGLDLHGALALDSAHVGDHLDVVDSSCRRTHDKRPALRGCFLRVGGTATFARLYCGGGVSLKDVRVGGSLDLSGSVVIAEGGTAFERPGGFVEDGITLEGGVIEGDLALNRRQLRTSIDEMVPTLVDGDVVATGVRIGGSFEASLVHVSKNLVLTSASADVDASLEGLEERRRASYSAAATLSSIGGLASFYNFRAGGMLSLASIAIGGVLDMAGLDARTLSLEPEEYYPLPVLIGLDPSPEASAPWGRLRLRRAEMESVRLSAVQIAGDALVRDVEVSGEFNVDGAWRRVLPMPVLQERFAALYASWGKAPAVTPKQASRLGWRDAYLREFRKWLRAWPDAEVEACPTRIGGGLRIINLRGKADVTVAAVVTGTCEIRDCTVAGDLEVRRTTLAGAAPPNATQSSLPTEVASLDMTGNEVEGRIQLVDLEVAGAIDLAHTHARRGITTIPEAGEGAGSAATVRAKTLDLRGFTTEADVDLAGLALPAGAGAKPATDESRVRMSERVLADLTGAADATLAADGLGVGVLAASHAKVGGRLRLPLSAETLRAVHLPFVRARALEVHGEAFRRDAARAVALDASNAEIDSFDLREPLPQLANLKNCKTVRWEVTGAAGMAAGRRRRSRARDEAGRYLELLDRSWPFAQDLYSRLERGYRDLGEQRMADLFLKRMGWRLWRWSYLRDACLGGSGGSRWDWALGLLIVGLVAGVSWGVASRALGIYVALAVVAFGVIAVWGWVGWQRLRNAMRFVLGWLIFPLHAVFGFGVRWWLPLVASASLLLLVTWPMLSDCRNLAASHRAAKSSTEQAAGGCDFPDGADAVAWTSSEAFWTAVRYHVPIISPEGFYHGEISEAVRPVGSGVPYLNGRPVDQSGIYRVLRWVPGVEWALASPERYARTVYLASWVVVPFSLIFFAGRLQRRYRLQQG